MRKFVSRSLALMAVTSMIATSAVYAETVQGTWSWNDPTIQPNAGTASFGATFTPADTDNYEVITTDISVTVNKYTPVVRTAPTVPTLSYGHILNDYTLENGVVEGANGATITGTWTWTDGSVTPTFGTTQYEATFTPTDTLNYNTITTNIEVTTNKYTPIVNVAPVASDITYRMSLSESSLTGSDVDVEGTWAWTDGSIKPNAGTREYEATFTPTDTTNYDTVTLNVSVTTAKYRPTIKELPTLPDNITYGVTLGDITLTGGTVE